MLNWLLGVQIDKDPFIIGLYCVMIAFCVVLIVRRPRRRWLITVAVALVGGALIGLVVTWLVGDAFDVFGLPFTLITRMWVSIVFAGILLAGINLYHSPWWRKVVAIIAIPVIILSGSVGINTDFGAYRNLRDALEINPFPNATAQELSGRAASMPANLATTWKPPADLPSKGIVRTVDIPAAVSHFGARAGEVYFPPAALVADPPPLPVIMMMSGQPGAPADMFTSGDTDRILNDYASAHHGLAPIVVAPDQLGAPNRNPMCVNSPLGNSATYLTVDVPNWIRTHLRVSDDTANWAVAGYSQGGTCAMQFGSAHPELFPSLLSISGEIAPTIGSQTVAKGFGGSVAAYRAAMPLNILAAQAPYRHSFAIFGVGANDQKYTAYARQNVAAAEKAGLQTELIVSPGTAHDWNTVRYVLTRGLPILSDHLGLAP